jgi:hypothetical protein
LCQAGESAAGIIRIVIGFAWIEDGRFGVGLVLFRFIIGTLIEPVFVFRVITLRYWYATPLFFIISFSPSYSFFVRGL